MSVKKDSIALTKIGLNTKAATEMLPVRVLEVNTTAEFGSFEYEHAVTAAVLAAKRAEQEGLQEQQSNSHGCSGSINEKEK
jgi:hypothetical protein